MSKCPSCGKILPDEWIRRQGAALLGRKGGSAKARTNAREAANIRWAKREPPIPPKKADKKRR
jgi:transposase-like protein